MTEELPTEELNQTVTEKTRWGFWPTLGLTLLAIIVLGFVQGLAMAVVSLSIGVPLENADTIAEGLLLERTFPFAAIAVILSVILFIKLREGFSIKDYLCFYRPISKTLFTWVGLLILLILTTDGLTYLFGIEVVPSGTVDTYLSSENNFLFFLSILVFAPLFEETLFRGFMLMGIKPKEGSPIFAIVLSSILWTSLHIQYDAYYLGLIFITGLFLGTAQIRTGSLVVPIVLHFFANLLASLELLTIVQNMSK